VGPHDLSVLLYLMDGLVPDTLSAIGRDHFLKNRDEVVFMTANYQDGPLVNIHESWLDPYKERKVIAVGTEGMLIMDEHATDGKVKYLKKTIKDTGSSIEHERFQYLDDGFEALDIAGDEPLASEITHFLTCVRDEKQPRSNADNSRKVLQLLLQAQESLDK
jgi:UDP-2-acetamido-3-amino-2,3-dideoxy-glucuronate N-acetyltransferase